MVPPPIDSTLEKTVHLSLATLFEARPSGMLARLSLKEPLGDAECTMKIRGHEGAYTVNVTYQGAGLGTVLMYESSRCWPICESSVEARAEDIIEWIIDNTDHEAG